MNGWQALGLLLFLLLAGAVVLVTAGDRNRKDQLDLSELRAYQARRDALRRSAGHDPAECDACTGRDRGAF